MHPLLYLKVNIFIHYEQSICFLMMSNFVTQKQKKYSHILGHSKSLTHGELCRGTRGSFQLWMNLGLKKLLSPFLPKS